MIHYLYLGHFEHDQDFIRFQKVPGTSPAWHRPVVRRPLDAEIIRSLLAEKGLAPESVPQEWGLSFENEGFILCDRYAGSEAVRDFVKQLAIRTSCDVADYGELRLLSPTQLWESELKLPSESPGARQFTRAS